MLEVRYIDNENILKPLYAKLFPEQKIAGVNAVLFENEKAIGACCMAVDDIVEIKSFAVLSEYDTFTNNDFFIRVILFKLSKIGCEIAVKGYDKRLEKFGFVKIDNEMRVLSNNIKFPSSCNK